MDRDRRANLSRRLIIRHGARVAVAGAALANLPLREARAQQKLTQAIAKYQDHPNGAQRCDLCIQFKAPATCQIVDGTISPQGWCQFFGPKSPA